MINCRNCQESSIFSLSLSFAVITTSSDSSKSQTAASAASTASTASDKTDEQNSDVAIATTNVRGTINLPVINGKIPSWQKGKPQKKTKHGFDVPFILCRSANFNKCWIIEWIFGFWLAGCYFIVIFSCLNNLALSNLNFWRTYFFVVLR